MHKEALRNVGPLFRSPAFSFGAWTQRLINFDALFSCPSPSLLFTSRAPTRLSRKSFPGILRNRLDLCHDLTNASDANIVHTNAPEYLR